MGRLKDSSQLQEQHQVGMATSVPETHPPAWGSVREEDLCPASSGLGCQPTPPEEPLWGL